MQAISNALNSLFEEGSWFARAKELRLLTIRLSGDLRKTALQMLAGLEFHHDNRSFWVVLEDAHTAADPGWRFRANRLLSHWEDRRRAFRKMEGLEIPEARLNASDPGTQSSSEASRPVAPMRQACAAILDALCLPLEGMIIVLAPGIVEDVEAIGSELARLAADPAISLCRWILVLDAAQSWPSVLNEFGELALRCECIPDPAQQKRDLDAMMSAPARMIGQAGPRGVIPPKRVDDPPPMPIEERDAMLRKAGIEPAYIEKAPDLQRLIFGAAIAMKDGKGADALRLQREARDLAISLRLHEVTVLCQVALGSYLSGLGQGDEALLELGSAIELAHRHGFGLLEAQAQLAVGLLLALAKRFPEAANQYAECARSSEAANIPVLAIEAWRMAGQVSLEGCDPRAVSFFREAIRVASGSEVDTVKNSTASEVARNLAALYTRLRMPAQAASLLVQADAMEHGQVGIKPTIEVET
jgi:hypothetical protein